MNRPLNKITGSAPAGNGKSGFPRYKLAAISLGCAKNRIDTEEILGYLAARGFIITDQYLLADVILINTCAFIEQAQQESINTILKVLEKTTKSRPLVIAAGCLVEVFGSNIIKSIPDIGGAIGVHSYAELDRFLKLLFSGRRAVLKKRPSRLYQSLSSRVLTTPAHTAFVKIADGCDNRCHYCMIPGIRGPYRSRDPEEIVGEINDLVTKGTAEVNLIAQDTTAYGSEHEDYPDLCGLIRKILRLEGSFRLRIMYTYPSRISDELIELVGSEKRICSYLDVPIQHSTDRMLERMGRLYRQDELSVLLVKMRQMVPDLALRTTLMVGYPGERGKDFQELLRFIEKYPFEHLGAFRYSCQEQTAAKNLSGHVPARISSRRYRMLMLRQQQVARLLNGKYLGKKLPVLVEGPVKTGSGWYYGRTEYQAPEVDGVVYFRFRRALKAGSWVSVTIKAVSPYNLLAADAKLLEKIPD